MVVFDKMESLFLVLLLQVVEMQLDSIIDNLESLLVLHTKEQLRLNRSLPVERQRVPWSLFVSNMPDFHFRRMFRMSPSMFTMLCVKIRDSVTEETFAPEASLMKKHAGSSCLRFISGEVKVALSVRLFAGGSCSDLVPLFGVSTSSLCRVFDDFLVWIARSLEFPLVGWLRQKNHGAVQSMADSFGEKSDGVFHGPFGALDGLAIKIRCLNRSVVSDPGNCCCRKGFCALHVQAICDRWKRFLWVYPSNKGSTHDSAAFAGSQLVELLQEMADELFERGLFIAGDSACSLSSFSVVPHDHTEVQLEKQRFARDARDSFNFHLSSCRIHIECAFGELIMRWGTFWRTLTFDLKKCAKITQVAMLLQNFMTEHRPSGVHDNAFFENFKMDSADPIQTEMTRQTGKIPRATASDNDEPKRAGRKTDDERV